MATWRRLIATSLLFMALLLLVANGHAPIEPSDGEMMHAAAIEVDQAHPCAVGRSCSAFVVLLEADLFGVDWPSSPAHLQGLSEPFYLSPDLSDDPPPPRRTT